MLSLLFPILILNFSLNSPSLSALNVIGIICSPVDFSSLGGITPLTLSKMNCLPQGVPGISIVNSQGMTPMLYMINLGSNKI